MSLDDTQREDMQRLLSKPIEFPDEFKRWMADYVATNIPMIPYSHIFGSHINLARSGTYIPTSETYAGSPTWGNLATVGPEITLLANGLYLVGFGVTSRGRAGLSFDGAAPITSPDYTVYAQESVDANARMQLKSFTGNNEHSVRVQYQDNRAYSNRWLFVIRIGAEDSAYA